MLDANILIRLVLGRAARELVLTYAGRVPLLTPDVCFKDARTYLPGLLTARAVDPEPAMRLLASFESVVTPVARSTYQSAREAALARIERRDPRDWPVLATALVLGVPIWTEDQDFFGTGVPTWTTDRVELYLNNVTTD